MALSDALRELDRISNAAAEIVDIRGAVIVHSATWWRRKARMNRP